MLKHLLKIRYLTVVIVIVTALHAVAFLVLGTRRAFDAYREVLAAANQGSAAHPGLEMLHALDLLIISMVLVVLSLGIAKLFLLDASAKESPLLPSWLKIDTISDLKVLLWETILTTLLIVAMSELTEGLFSKQDSTVLLVPIAILILALSLYFMKKS